MTSETESLTPTCNKHTPPVSLNVADPVTDESRVACPVCGDDFGSWAEVKQQMVELRKAQLEQQMRDGMRDAGWKVT